MDNVESNTEEKITQPDISQEVKEVAKKSGEFFVQYLIEIFQRENIKALEGTPLANFLPLSALALMISSLCQSLATTYVQVGNKYATARSIFNGVQELVNLDIEYVEKLKKDNE